MKIASHPTKIPMRPEDGLLPVVCVCQITHLFLEQGYPLRLIQNVWFTVLAGEAAEMALGNLVSSKMEIVGRRAEEELRQMQEEEDKARKRQEQGMMQRNLASNLASIHGGGGAGRMNSLAAGQSRGARVGSRAGAGEMGTLQGPEAKESFRIGGGDVTMLPAKVEFQFPDARYLIVAPPLPPFLLLLLSIYYHQCFCP